MINLFLPSLGCLPSVFALTAKSSCKGNWPSSTLQMTICKWADFRDSGHEPPTLYSQCLILSPFHSRQRLVGMAELPVEWLYNKHCWEWNIFNLAWLPKMGAAVWYGFCSVGSVGWLWRQTWKLSGTDTLRDETWQSKNFVTVLQITHLHQNNSH